MIQHVPKTARVTPGETQMRAYEVSSLEQMTDIFQSVDLGRRGGGIPEVMQDSMNTVFHEFTHGKQHEVAFNEALARLNDGQYTSGNRFDKIKNDPKYYSNCDNRLYDTPHCLYYQ